MKLSNSTLALVTLILGTSMANGFAVHSGSSSSSNKVSSTRSSSALHQSNSYDDNGDDERRDDILKQLTEKYLGSMPDRSAILNRKFELQDEKVKDKGDLYEDEELESLLELHKQLSPKTQAKKETEDPQDLIPSLHDLVQLAVQEADDKEGANENTKKDDDQADGHSFPWLTDEIVRNKLPLIKAIASDVDGTLVTPEGGMHPRTKSAIQRAVQAAFSPIDKLSYFFPATGKTRWGTLNSMGEEVASVVRQCPGVYIQGLYCVNANDEVIFEKRLITSAVEAAEELAAEYGAAIVAYDGDNLYSTDPTKQEVIDLHKKWGEPMSEPIDAISKHGPSVHKILIMDDDLEKLAEIRPKLEALGWDFEACVTQAIPSMLEFLPQGCSKGLGVQKLCEHLGIDPATQLLALGDAENDAEMLEMSSIGVAVGNAGTIAREAADIVLDETADEGGAGLAMEVLGGI